MHLRVLSLRVPITGIHILSSIEKSRHPPIGAGEIDRLPVASKAELRVKVPQIWRHFLYMLNRNSIKYQVQSSHSQ